MIHHLRGLLVEKQPPTLVMEVQGVGYEVEAPMSTFYQLPEVNTTIYLVTHLIVREDAHILYGFSSEQERRLFRALIRVNGVGPKLALAILSAIDVITFIHAIQQGETHQLIRIPGVGKKTAERLIIEMRDRLTTSSIQPSTTTPVASLTAGVTSPKDDAISALIALGYKPQEASRWVNQVHAPNLTSEELIRRALQAAL